MFSIPINKKIIFESDLVGLVEEPKPALQSIPESFKQLNKILNNRRIARTVKSCVPFLDALKFGYTIPFPIDYEVHYEDGHLNFNISTYISGTPIAEKLGIENHSNNQVPENLRHDKRTVDVPLKFRNIWKITTPPGYSCLFTQPLNRNAPFKIVDGVVDTDKFSMTIHFPFYWTGDTDKIYTLEHGTPMVQVIPFKRDDWQMEIKNNPNVYPEEFTEKIRLSKRLVDTYKNVFWSKKRYK